MKDRDMYLELKENEVKDNPFDVMLHYSIELTRDLLFACHRLKNPEIPEQICTNEKKLESYMDKIREEFSKLLSMSNETVAMCCRETSYYYQQDKFDKMNKSLLEFDRSMKLFGVDVYQIETTDLNRLDLVKSQKNIKDYLN